MGFIGYTPDGLPAFDVIGDVPDFYINEGRQFALNKSYLPFDPKQGQAHPVWSNTPDFSWVAVLVAVVIFLIILAAITIAVTTIVTSFKPTCLANQISDTMYQTCDGSTLCKGVDGSWTQCAGPPTSPGADISGIVWGFAIIAVVGVGAYAAIKVIPELTKKREASKPSDAKEAV